MITLRTHRAVTALACATIPLFVVAPAHGDAGALTQAQRTQIDALFAGYDRSTPGCAMGILRDGHIAYSRGYGMADLERAVPIAPSTLFDVGSVSKQFTAAAVLLLAADGKLSIDDDVRKYIPELPQYGTPITIDHLMHHTSGLRDYVALLSLSGIAYQDVSTNEQALAIATRQRALNFPTGARYEYSNTNYLLLALIVERASGESLADFVRQRIFDPLGMRNARIRDEHAMLVPNRALGYSPAGGREYKLAVVNWEQTGDGAAQISVEEALIWAHNFFEPRLGGRALVDLLQERGKLSNGESINYARGLMVDSYRGLHRVHHGGAWLGYRAMLELFPDHDVAIAVFCNVDGSNPAGLSRQIADVVLADAMDDSPPPASAVKMTTATASSLPLERLVGRYFDPDGHLILETVEHEGSLALKAFGAMLPLVATGPTSFALQGYPGTVEFSVRDGASVDSLVLRLEGDPATTATRLPPWSVDENRLRQYVGTFYSPELDVRWEMEIAESALALRRTTRKFESRSEPLEAVMKDAFNGPSGFVRFRRSDTGRITGFELSTARMRGIAFEAED